MNPEFPINREVVDISQDIYACMFDSIINIIGMSCLGMSIVFIKIRSLYQILQLSHIDLHFDFKSLL